MKKVFTFLLFAFCSITWAQTTPKQLKKALKESAEKTASELFSENVVLHALKGVKF